MISLMLAAKLPMGGFKLAGSKSETMDFIKNNPQVKNVNEMMNDHVCNINNFMEFSGCALLGK